MRKLVCVFVFMSMACTGRGSLLVEETWNYGVGSDSSTWTGGVGYVSTQWVVPTTFNAKTTLTNGLTFGSMQVSGGSVHIKATAVGTGLSGVSFERRMNIATVNSGDLWISYLVKYDATNGTNPYHEWIEIRPESTKAPGMRTGVAEARAAMTLRSGTDTTIGSITNVSLKTGETFLFVYKYAGLGASSGSSALGWGLTSTEYDSIASGGITEAELNAAASLKVDNSFEPTNSLVGTETCQFYMMGRGDGLTPAFYLDEYRVGTSLTDVVAVPEPTTIGMLGAAAGVILIFRRMRLV